MPTSKQACEACDATGLYQGFAEGKNEAVVCLRCEGKGWHIYKYKEFKGRQKRAGVNHIRVSAGAFIATGVGGRGELMTYTEFEKSHPS